MLCQRAISPIAYAMASSIPHYDKCRTDFERGKIARFKDGSNLNLDGKDLRKMDWKANGPY
ncbi:Putative protein [Zobellia galactanivorans]|uniref:Uncharacterized protein n=1 Tax=Zobellia galactanivorans (strain DSM 12802 / CCUG 47099 / CIP 106680 / NCIMB 13871 / Dsij) TaxID=63186 RepID=G0L3T6_ZOBGA|nr:Putative protein [Zobellia galactanivorans]